MEIQNNMQCEPYTALDFFAGSGLVTYSLSPNFNVVWANDISEQKALVYTRNHGSDHFRLADINRLKFSLFPKHRSLLDELPLPRPFVSGLRRRHSREADSYGSCLVLWKQWIGLQTFLSPKR